MRWPTLPWPSSRQSPRKCARFCPIRPRSTACERRRGPRGVDRRARDGRGPPPGRLRGLKLLVDLGLALRQVCVHERGGRMVPSRVIRKVAHESTSVAKRARSRFRNTEPLTQRTQDRGRWPSRSGRRPVLQCRCARGGGKSPHAACSTPIRPIFPRTRPIGCGQTVIVLPGFCAPDLSTDTPAEFPQASGLRRASPGTAAPISADAHDPDQPRAAARRGGRKTANRPVALVGISLGGTIARESPSGGPNASTT